METRPLTHPGLHQNPVGDEQGIADAKLLGDCNHVNPFYRNLERYQGRSVFLVAPRQCTSARGY